MQLKRKTILYTSILCTAGMAIAIVLLTVIHFERRALINYIIQISGRPYLLNILEQKIITPQKFRLIKIACYAMLAGDVATVLALYYHRRRVLAGLQFIYHCISSAIIAVIAVFGQNRKKDNLVFATLLVITTARSIYYILHFELQYDEMWSYNYFTARPFYFSIFSYNNYPLYQLSTQVFKWLPLGMKVNLRLPVLLAGLSSCIIVYACIKKYTGHALTAVVATALFACMPVTTFYMLYARGVMFELFFAIVAIFSVLYMFKSNKPSRYTAVYVIANVLAMYSMPTHVYFLALLIVCSLAYILWNKSVLLRPFILCNLLVLAMVFLCYLPVIAGSGLSFVLNAAANPGPVNISLNDVVGYNKSIGVFFTNYPYGLLILIVTTMVLLIALKKINAKTLFIAAFSILLLCLPSVIYICQHTTIPERSIAFVGLVIPACFALLAFAFKDAINANLTAAFTGVVFILGCFISNNHTYLHWSEQKDKKAITISELLMQHHVKTCYDNSTGSGFFYYYPALEYYYGQKKRILSLTMAAPNSLRYKPLLPADDYDCMIMPIGSTSPNAKNYTVAYRDQEEGFTIFIK